MIEDFNNRSEEFKAMDELREKIIREFFMVPPPGEDEIDRLVMKIEAGLFPKWPLCGRSWPDPQPLYIQELGRWNRDMNELSRALASLQELEEREASSTGSDIGYCRDVELRGVWE